jgi:prophage antirepressor-like protein
MNNHTSLVPHWFEGHRIRLSRDANGEAWFVIADVCAALTESPMAWALTARREEEHGLHSEEGPGSQGLTLALINEAGLLRRLLDGESPIATRMRRWLTHELLPSMHRPAVRAALPRPAPDGMQTQNAKAVLRIAEDIIELTGVRQSDALAAALADVEVNTGLQIAPLLQVLRDLEPAASDHRHRQLEAQPVEVRLNAEQLAEQLGCAIRDTNRQLAACGLQVRNVLDDWQLTKVGRDWGQTLPTCARGQRGQQILWNPAVMALLREELP